MPSITSDEEWMDMGREIVRIQDVDFHFSGGRSYWIAQTARDDRERYKNPYSLERLSQSTLLVLIKVTFSQMLSVHRKAGDHAFLRP